MAEIIRVVVRYRDGSVLKGTTKDFLPNKPLFHLEPAGENSNVVVQCKSLKAVFFVRSFRGNPQRSELPGFLAAPVANKKGRKVAVRFADGEIVCGYTMTYGPDREGFFIVPADPRSNNLRMYVVLAATDEIQVGPAADELVERTLLHTRGAAV